MHENILNLILKIKKIQTYSNVKNQWNLSYIPPIFYVFHQYLLLDDYIQSIFDVCG